MQRESTGPQPNTRKSSDCYRSGPNQCSAPATGFSLIELLVVVAIMLVVAAFAIPTLSTTMDSYRLHSTLGSAANMVQRARMQAIKRNITQHIHFATVNNRAAIFVTDIDDTVSVTAPVPGAANDPKLSAEFWLSSQFALSGVPSGTGAPAALTGALMWGTSLPINSSPQDPYFNSRGMPCLPDPITTVCVPVNGFVYYYQYHGSRATRWAATSISAAGLIQSWFWNGTSWGN